MNDPSLPVVLSQKARRDFVDILRYTAEQWGKAQLEIYRRKIDTAIQRISRNPEIGALRHDLDQPYRIFPVGVHLIPSARKQDSAYTHSASTWTRRIATDDPRFS